MLIRDRLEAIPDFGGRDERHEIARMMVRDSDFQDAKLAFGSEGADWPKLPLSIPGLDRKTRGPDISNGVLRIRRLVYLANYLLGLVVGSVQLTETN